MIYKRKNERSKSGAGRNMIWLNRASVMRIWEHGNIRSVSGRDVVRGEIFCELGRSVTNHLFVSSASSKYKGSFTATLRQRSDAIMEAL